MKFLKGIKNDYIRTSNDNCWKRRKRAKKRKNVMSEEARKNWEERCTSYGPCIIVEKAKKPSKTSKNNSNL